MQTCSTRDVIMQSLQTGQLIKRRVVKYQHCTYCTFYHNRRQRGPADLRDGEGEETMMGERLRVTGHCWLASGLTVYSGGLKILHHWEDTYKLYEQAFDALKDKQFILVSRTSLSVCVIRTLTWPTKQIADMSLWILIVQYVRQNKVRNIPQEGSTSKEVGLGTIQCSSASISCGFFYDWLINHLVMKTSTKDLKWKKTSSKVN